MRSNLPQLPNTMVMVMNCWMSNGNDIVLSLNQLQAAYTEVRHWEELIDFINTKGHPKEPYIPTSRFQCTLEKDELGEEFMGLHTIGQMIMGSIFGQISYNCFFSNAFKLKLRHDLKIFVVEMK
jgi:hypothetical protein